MRTAERDLFAKRDDYSRAGLANYWIVDPVAAELSIDEPFSLRLRPADLVR